MKNAPFPNVKELEENKNVFSYGLLNFPFVKFQSTEQATIYELNETR